MEIDGIIPDYLIFRRLDEAEVYRSKDANARAVLKVLDGHSDKTFLSIIEMVLEYKGLKNDMLKLLSKWR
jgi:hypothetical protein